MRNSIMIQLCGDTQHNITYIHIENYNNIVQHGKHKYITQYTRTKAV